MPGGFIRCCSGAFPVLFLFAANLNEQVTLEPLELLPDRNLTFVDQLHIYETIDVTDRVVDAMR